MSLEKYNLSFKMYCPLSEEALSKIKKVELEERLKEKTGKTYIYEEEDYKSEDLPRIKSGESKTLETTKIIVLMDSLWHYTADAAQDLPEKIKEEGITETVAMIMCLFVLEELLPPAESEELSNENKRVIIQKATQKVFSYLKYLMVNPLGLEKELMEFREK